MSETEGVSQTDPEQIRLYGVEPDFTLYKYDLNSCGYCGQPVLIVTSKELQRGGRTEMTPCSNCMGRLSKRTRAKIFQWHFLTGWQPE